MNFRNFVIMSPWKNACPSIGTNLNLFHLIGLCAKFGLNWESGSGEEDYLNFVNVFSLFHYSLSLEKELTFYLNKLKSNSSSDAFCQV